MAKRLSTLMIGFPQIILPELSCHFSGICTIIIEPALDYWKLRNKLWARFVATNQTFHRTGLHNKSRWLAMVATGKHKRTRSICQIDSRGDFCGLMQPNRTSHNNCINISGTPTRNGLRRQKLAKAGHIPSNIINSGQWWWGRMAKKTLQIFTTLNRVPGKPPRKPKWPSGLLVKSTHTHKLAQLFILHRIEATWPDWIELNRGRSTAAAGTQLGNLNFSITPSEWLNAAIDRWI